MKLIVGLGNPGTKYENTRHNIGFKILDFFAYQNKLEIDKEKFNALYIKENDFILLKPQTYMNLSGDSIKAVVDFYKIKTEDILVIHDDIDRIVGKFQVKKAGSANGQNGMKDIIRKLKTEEINRIKIGIGRDEDVTAHVLGQFSTEDKNILDGIAIKVVEVINDFITIGKGGI